MIPINFLKSQKGVRILEIAIYSVIVFTVVSAFRTYHLASGYGYFDPWIQIGYGQLFPDTSFDFHYYKESRVLSIAWTAFILQFDAGSVNLFWLLLVTATSVMTYLTFRLANKNRIVSAIGGFFIALSFPLWGDYAGGGDYYNTLGNLIIAIACYFTFVVLHNLSNTKLRLDNSKLYFLLGILFSIIALETPSGVTVLLPLQLLVVIRTWHVSKNRNQKTAKNLFKLVQFQILGFLTLILFETLMLLAMNQNPSRLLTGPQFLIKSITDSSTTSPWAKPLRFEDFLSQPNLLMFITLLIAEFLYLISLFFDTRQQSTRKFVLLSASVPFLFYVLLISLQMLERTIILTTSYFLTPVILLGFTLISRFEISLNRYWSIASILLVLTLVFTSRSDWTLFLGSIFFIGVLGYNLNLRKQGNLNQFIPTFIAFLILTFALKLLSPIILNNRTNNFEVCETSRIEMRAEVIKVSNLLDDFDFPRGTLIMGADLETIRTRISSECGDFNNKPLGGILIAISQTGFPSAAVLGTVKSGLEYQRDNFVEQNLAYLESRTNPPTSCYINFTAPSEDSELALTIAGVEVGVDLNCPK